MAGVVQRTFPIFAVLGLALSAQPAAVFAQSSGWGEPITAPSKPSSPAEPRREPAEPAQPGSVEPAEPGRTEPNPDWADAPPSQSEQRSASNPDWVEETAAPVIENTKRRASEFYDLRYANRSLTMPRGMMR